MQLDRQPVPRQLVLVSAVRVGLLAATLFVHILSQLLQKEFINIDLHLPIFALLSFGFLEQSLFVGLLERIKENRRIWISSFLLQVFVVTGFVVTTGLSQSMFMFLYMVNIILAALVLGLRGGTWVAFVSSILFSLSVLLYSEMRGPSALFLLLLNNMTFFVVAGLAGYFGEQINFMGRELKESQKKVQDLANLNELIIENLPVGLVAFRNSGEISFSNPASARLLESRLRAQDSLFEIWPELAQQSERGDLTEGSHDIPRAKDRRLFGCHFSQFREPGSQRKLSLLVFEDLTRVRKLENQVKQKEKLAAIGQLAAGIAHEIRNPLASISGSVEMISSNSPNEDDQKLLRIILRETDRLNHLISEFLDYARPASEPTDSVCLEKVILECLEILRVGELKGKDISLEVKTSPGVITGDKDKLKQAFLNILINAVHAVDGRADPRIQVHVTASKSEEIFQVMIGDNGVGMSEEGLKRIFEPFHTTKPKGTGLGLALTHKIVEIHQGRIIVESELDQGTRFILDFPRDSSRLSVDK